MSTDTTENETVIPGVRHMLSIPSPQGDVRIMWDPRDKESVKVAEKAFDEAMHGPNKMIAHTVDNETGGPTNEVITKFDKKLGKIIMRRQSAAG